MSENANAVQCHFFFSFFFPRIADCFGILLHRSSVIFFISFIVQVNYILDDFLMVIKLDFVINNSWCEY